MKRAKRTKDDERRDALCEYVDGLREAGRSYDEIAETLAGVLTERDLARLEVWHRQWKRAQWRAEAKRQRLMVALDDSHAAITDMRESGATEPVVERGEKELVRYLAERLVGHEIPPRGQRRWMPLCTRVLTDGQTCEAVKGPGQAGGCRWMHSAVIFRTGTHIDHVEPEARIRERIKPESRQAAKNRWKRPMVRLEKLQLVERLNHKEMNAKLAALVQTFLGKASGIRSGAHLGRLTDRTRAAVSARKLHIVEEYYEATGGKAGFEGVKSAARHRGKAEKLSRLRETGEPDPKKRAKTEKLNGDAAGAPPQQKPSGVWGQSQLIAAEQAVLNDQPKPQTPP